MLRALSKDSYKYSGIYRAKVENSNDPYGRGRVQVRVYPMMEGIASSDLPWAEPCWSSMLKVPQAGNWVWVMFVEGDITRPVWLGWSIPFSESGINYQGGETGSSYDSREFIGKEIWQESSAEYPEAVVFRHRSGSKFIFYNNGRVHIESSAGAKVVLGEDGKILIQGVRIDLNP